MNNYTKSNELYWWWLSLSGYDADGGDCTFRLDYDGSLNCDYVSSSGSVNVSGRSRPTVSLKSNVQISGGNGTISNPYVIS